MVGTNSTNNGENESCWNFGSLSISGPAIADFSGVTLDGTAQTTNAVMNPFIVTDSRGTGSGWHITVQATQFAQHDGTIYVALGKTLPLSSLTMPEPTVSGDPAPPTITAGPYIIDSGSAVTIASAASGDGMGAYTFTSGVGGLELSISANGVYANEVGQTYRSDVTISEVNGP
jgi:hypothetical protein